MTEILKPDHGKKIAVPRKQTPQQEAFSRFIRDLRKKQQLAAQRNKDWIGCQIGPTGNRAIFHGDHDPDND